MPAERPAEKTPALYRKWPCDAVPTHTLSNSGFNSSRLPLFTHTRRLQEATSNRTTIEITVLTNSNALVLIAVCSRQYLLAAHFLIFSTTSLQREKVSRTNKLISMYHFTNIFDFGSSCSLSVLSVAQTAIPTTNAVRQATRVCAAGLDEARSYTFPDPHSFVSN